MKNDNKNNLNFDLLQHPHSKEFLFFGFYLIFFGFLIFLGLKSGSSNIKKEEPVNKEDEIIIINNYEFLWEIRFKEEDNQNCFLLEGKRYQDKFLVYKYIDGIYKGEYYLENDLLKIKKGDDFEEIDGYLIKEDFNQQWLDLNYLNGYLEEGVFIEKFQRFDGSLSKRYKIDDNFFITLNSKKDGTEEIVVENILFDIFLQYKNINKVIDFDI
ncbi:MAG: hypothetical protein ACOXZR_03025 [Bacilli bacterium]